MEDRVLVKTEGALRLPTWPWSLCLRCILVQQGWGGSLPGGFSPGDIAKQVDFQAQAPSF